MPNPLARGISVNPRTRCFVREKPKDVARLDPKRASSMKQLGLGLRIPLTDFEGVQEEEAAIPARGAQPGRGPPQEHPIINGPMDETVKERPVTEGGRGESSRARQNQQGREQGQRPPSRVVEQGLPNQQAGSRRSRNEALGQPSHRPRPSQHESRRPPVPIAQTPDTPHPQAPQAPSLRHSSGSRDHARSHHSAPRTPGPEMPVSSAHNNAEERRSRSNADGQRSRYSVRDAPPNLLYQQQQEQGEPAPQRVQQLQNEESRSSCSNHASRESRHSARASVQETRERFPARH